MRKAAFRCFWLAAMCCGLFGGALPSAQAFALLGPFGPPEVTNYLTASYNDIGAPMALGEEYRWNVPVVTYGFDQSFLDYFGQPGVDAVEKAIQIINALPPASNIVSTNYALNTTRVNYRAESESLFDMKSVALSLLLERMGLASPTENIWFLEHWDSVPCQWVFFVSSGYGIIPEAGVPTNQFYPYYAAYRNYDPGSLQATKYVNGILYTFNLYTLPNCTSAAFAIFPVDPLSQSQQSTVRDFSLAPGKFYTDLTYDDVGGLAYLYSRTNVHVESLGADVSLTDGHTNHKGKRTGEKRRDDAFVRVASRPGVEKVTFMRQPTNAAGQFVAFTNQFVDTYITNGIPMTQTVQRVTTQPDILFTAADQPFFFSASYPYVESYFLFNRTDTSNWVNNNTLNGNPSGYGPGTIQGSAQIAFPKTAAYIAAGGLNNTALVQPTQMGTFDGSTNVPVALGSLPNITSLTLSMQAVAANGPPTFQWAVLGHQNATYRIDVSTNLTDWNPAAEITNTAGIFFYTNALDQPAQYFRAVLE